MQAEITHRRVLAVALPIVLSNITVPLLGVVDTFAVGQIGDAASKSNVAVVQGSAFGLDGYFRISYATSMQNLKKAMQRIKTFCESLS